VASFTTLQRASFGAAAILVANAFVSVSVSAQSLWTGPQSTMEKPSFQIETFRPQFSDDELEFVGATGSGFVTARLPLASRFALIADLPFARAAWDVDGTANVAASESLIGNPFVGVDWQTSERFSAELGLRLPTLAEPEDAEDLGVLAPMVVGLAAEIERMEAFTPEVLGIYAAGSYRAPLTSSLTASVRANTALLTGEGAAEDVLLGYTGQLWYTAGRADLGAGVTGRWNITEDGLGQERATHQAILGGGYTVGRVRPGLQIRLPLDGAMKNLTGFTAGFSLGYSF
jgi:hypothetical protein